ncbi:MAG: prepilin peptidase [Campylobacterota bacterium]|nr:prepilin peptidase [Campylobacterota bacterium]
MILSLILTKERDGLEGFNILIFIIGVLFGSFLNMLIYRLPLDISLIDPKRSICRSCNNIIRWYENIPLVSYIFLKGRCSNCGDKISITYPIVEFLTGLVTLTLFIKLDINIDFFIYIILFYTLIVLSFIDFKYKAVPDYLLILALIISFFISSFDFKSMFLFAGGIVLLEIFITFYIQNIKSRITKDKSLETQKALGEGDIPIVAIIGGVLGVKFGLLAIFLSAIFAIIPSLLNSIIKKDIETPFIPYLALALFVVFITENFFLYLLEGIR